MQKVSVGNRLAKLFQQSNLHAYLPRVGRPMRHFSLFIENKILGPLTEDEISAMIAEGKLTPDSPCAPEGSTEWEPAARYFKFNEGLKVNWTKPVQNDGEAEAASLRITLETRQKLMTYGLADSISIERFTQIQADLAISAHETQLRSTIQSQGIVRATALVVAAAVSLWFGLGENFAGEALSAAAGTVVREEGNAQAGFKQLNYELQQFVGVRQRADEAKFLNPNGGTPALSLVQARLKINPNAAFTFQGKVDTSPLAKDIAKWGIKIGADIKVYALTAALPARTVTLLNDQATMLEDVLAPALDDAGFQKLFAAVMETYPVAGDFPESAKLKSDAKGVRMSSLAIFIDRAELRVRAADKIPAQNHWAVELHAFIERLNQLQRKVYTLTAPEARRARWSEFNAGPGAELASWILTANAKQGSAAADGSLTINETTHISIDTLEQVIVTLRINGDLVFLRWNSHFLKTTPFTCQELPQAYFLEREKYVVVSKTTTGGVRLLAKSHSPSHDFYLERTSPQWPFLIVARAGDTDPLSLLVDAKTYAEYEAGKALPMSLIRTLNAYPRPVDSPIPDPFTAVNAPQ